MHRKSSQLQGTGAFAETVKHLLVVLETGTQEDAGRATRALVAIGPDAAPAVPALTARLAAKRHVEPTVEALGAIGPAAKPAVPALIALLAERGRRDWATRAVPRALAAIGDPAAVPALLEAARDRSDQGPGHAALRALGELAAREATPELLELAADERVEPSTRRAIVRTLSKLGPPSGPVLEAVRASGDIEALYHLLFTRREEERIDAGVVADFLAVLDREADDDSVKWALYALQHLQEERAAPRSIELLRKGSVEAARLLGMLQGTPERRDALRRAVVEGDARLRCVAALALSWHGPEAIEVLPLLEASRAEGRLAEPWLDWEGVLGRLRGTTESVHRDAEGRHVLHARRWLGATSSSPPSLPSSSPSSGP